jgi:hypothetical protein
LFPSSQVDQLNRSSFCRDDGTVAIIDGQHRVGAINILASENRLAAGTTVLLEVHRVQNEAHIAKLFTDINRSVPVHLVDMPNVNAADKTMLSAAATTMKEQFPSMFSESIKCRMPHLNFDTLRDDIYRSKIVSKYELKSEEALIAWLRKQNQALPQLHAASWAERSSNATFQKALTKCKIHGFYLGLDKSWLD